MMNQHCNKYLRKYTRQRKDRYCLMAEMVLGSDASFTQASFIKRYNSDLANDLGNMLSRAVKLTIKYFDGRVPRPGNLEDVDLELKDQAIASIGLMRNAVENMKIDRGLEHVMNVVRAANRYMEKTAPWTLAKQGNMERLATVLYTASETLRIVSGLLLPVMPCKMKEFRMKLGLPEDIAAKSDFSGRLEKWGTLEFGTQVHDIEALFPRIVIEDPMAQLKAEGKKAKPKPEAVRTETVAVGENMVTIDEFFKTQLKTAKVLEAEKVEGADKLLKLKIELGNETRQIVSGIAKHYRPEELVGKIIIVVANLKPAKIRGIESFGMLLAAKTGDTLKLATIDGGDFPSGIAVG